MYTSANLHALIKKLDCEIKGKEYKALCKVCGLKSLFINPGRKKVAIVFCNNCGVDKKDEVFAALNVSYDEFGPEMSTEDIDRIWEEVNPEFRRTKPKEDRLQIASSSVLNTCYSYLLRHEYCRLIPQHSEWLESRGLPKDYATSIGYASTPTELHNQLIADELFKIVGEQLLQVPGFVRQNGKCRIRIMEGGIFHPQRNFDGQVESVKIRKPKATKNDRLITMSSASCDGPSAVAKCHIPLGVSKLADTKTVWLTEGERKADVIFHRLKVATIGVPGSQNVKMAMVELDRMGCEKLIMAMDKDKAGEFATINLRYEHEIKQVKNREFFYADWEHSKEDDK